MYITTFMYTPTLPLFAKSIGVSSPSVGGIIILVYTVGCLISRSLWGDIADHWRKKPVYLIGILIMVLAIPFFGIFVSLTGILCLRFIQGIGFSASSTTGSAIAADLVPTSRLTEGIGYYTLANTIGMALGPGLGIDMLQHHGSHSLFIAGIIAGIISFVLGLFLHYEPKFTGDTSKTKSATAKNKLTTNTERPAKRNILFESSVLPACAVMLFVIMPYGAIMAYIASFGIAKGVSNIGLYFSVFALALFLVRLVVGRVSDQYGVTIIIIPGFVLMAIGLIVLKWASSMTVFMTSAVFFGLGFGVTFPLLQATAYIFCKPNRRGVASATLFATADLAYGFGALILGIAIKFIGYASSFSLLALFEIVSLALYMILIYPKISVKTVVRKHQIHSKKP